LEYIAPNYIYGLIFPKKDLPLVKKQKRKKGRQALNSQVIFYLEKERPAPNFQPLL
jgi:hypothetical protein